MNFARPDSMRRWLFRSRSAAAAVLLGTVVLGCSTKSSPSSPGQVNVTGTWTGDLTVLQMPVRMTWTLTQTDATSVNGPALLGVSSGTVLLNGFLVGTLSGSTLTYTISVGPGGIPTQPTCAGQIGGTMNVTISGTATMTGTSAVTGSNCTPPFPGGTLTLTRQ
jgi:hypothetical protein